MRKKYARALLMIASWIKPIPNPAEKESGPPLASESSLGGDMFWASHSVKRRRGLITSMAQWILRIVLAASIAGAAAAEELVLLNWVDYIDPEIIAEFETEFESKVKIIIFELDEARDSLIVKRGPVYDLMVIDGSSIAAYVRRGWLAPLSMAEVPNLRHVKPSWMKFHEGVEGNVAPYFWGTTGIAYRSDLVSGPIHSWRQLLEPEENLRGRISMMGQGRDLMVPALKLMGHSLNFGDKGVIPELEAMLMAQKPYVRTYVYPSTLENSTLVTGEVWMGLAYSGGAMQLRKHQPAIKYVVPDEGTNIWQDYIGVSAHSPRKKLAARFIDFLNRPKIAARNALWVACASPNAAAEEHLPSSFLEDPVIYPSEEVLSRSESYRPLAPRVRKSLNASLNRILN